MKKKLMALLLVLLLSLFLAACGGDKQDNAGNKGNADNKDVLADWQQLPAQFMLTFDAADGIGDATSEYTIYVEQQADGLWQTSVVLEDAHYEDYLLKGELSYDAAGQTYTIANDERELSFRLDLSGREPSYASYPIIFGGDLLLFAKGDISGELTIPHEIYNPPMFVDTTYTTTVVDSVVEMLTDYADSDANYAETTRFALVQTPYPLVSPKEADYNSNEYIFDNKLDDVLAIYDSRGVLAHNCPAEGVAFVTTAEEKAVFITSELSQGYSVMGNSVKFYDEGYLGGAPYYYVLPLDEARMVYSATYHPDSSTETEWESRWLLDPQQPYTFWGIVNSGELKDSYKGDQVELYVFILEPTHITKLLVGDIRQKTTNGSAYLFQTVGIYDGEIAGTFDMADGFRLY